MWLGQVPPTPGERIDNVNQELKEGFFNNKEIIEKDNWTKVDELLKKLWDDWVLDTEDSKIIYAQIT